MQSKSDGSIPREVRPVTARCVSYLVLVGPLLGKGTNEQPLVTRTEVFPCICTLQVVPVHGRTLRVQFLIRFMGVTMTKETVFSVCDRGRGEFGEKKLQWFKFYDDAEFEEVQVILLQLLYGQPYGV
mmetsp:Transcript_60826/g.131978  ORF Transcript_60826/g.131978 Transcript_60826/m.131978 type:complete len:127 (+) Transcript_60826:132-512(+)